MSLNFSNPQPQASLVTLLKLLKKNPMLTLMTSQDKLLRLRKDLPTTFPCLHAQSTWSRLVAPLFPSSQLVQQSLVSLRPDTYNHITTLNSSLLAWENEKDSLTTISKNQGARPLKRHKVYLSNDPHGLLVTDMSSPGVVQFKPKWLAQSPTAPRGARRCRQCALGARKAFLSLASSSSASSASLSSSQEVHQGKEKSGGENAQSFCPLDLLSTDPDVVRGVAGAILGSGASEEEIKVFASWISRTPLLRRLRDVQLAMDRHGVLAAETASEELRVAMTVRDCSVFVRLGGSTIEWGGRGGEESDGEVEARIGDLDVKSPEKLEYWKETERVLVEEGWYGGRVEGEGQGGRNTCSLRRG